jgi:hypothetical protein
MKEIIDHDKGRNALNEENAYYSTKAGPNPRERREDGVSSLSGMMVQALGYRWQT